MRMDAKSALRLARPTHWVKNVLVLLPVVFSLRAGEGAVWARAAMAAAAFCLVSSAVYVLNDIADRKRDRRHPRKKRRPLAAGQVTVGAATVEAAALLLAGGAVALRCGMPVLLVVAAYLGLQASYTSYFKHRMLLDVICIALGFVLRAVGGAVAIGVEISPWLFVCTFTICLFMGFCKRCNEAVTLGEAGGQEEARSHRATLIGYTPELLTHLITLSAGIAVVGFLLYATSPRTVANLGTNYLIYTLPAVIYAVARFAMLSMRGRYADPVDLIAHDGPFAVTVLTWAVAAAAIIRWGRPLQDWLATFSG